MKQVFAVRPGTVDTSSSTIAWSTLDCVVSTRFAITRPHSLQSWNAKSMSLLGLQLRDHTG